MLDRDELELGEVAARLRARGYRWTAIAEALGTPFPGKVREAAIKYLLWAEQQAARQAHEVSPEG